MSARKRSNNPLKIEKIEIRVTEEQKEEIRTLAASVGLNISAFMLMCYKMQSNSIFNINTCDVENSN